MADNCGAKFHALVISPQTDATVKQKVIQLLAALANTFQNEPSLYQFYNLYTKLTGNQGSQVPSQTRYYDGQDRNWDVSLEAKIAEDIEVAKNNVQLLTQTLSFTDPESEDITKNELIQEFYKKCQALHDNLMKYLSEVQDEEWIVNQELLNGFKMYDDMVERGLLLVAKLKSTKITNRRDEENLFNEGLESAAGVGGRETPYEDPFGDNNGYNDHKIQSGPSSKALGKMPASIYNDDSIFKEEPQDQNNKDKKYSNISTPPIQPYKV
ncbi:11491_t:CDS:2 [Entrophospora sp. SA101]|nr:11491_t:CDS:2 [Entrophospora sp. SA101]CAJ0879229.1 16743_t:CDS:2 [Entrophospora sp. SA101]